MSSDNSLESEIVLKKILAFIHEFFGGTEVGADDDLYKTGILDSLRTVELIYFLEKQFAIELPSEALNEKDLRTPKVITSLIVRHLSH